MSYSYDRNEDDNLRTLHASLKLSMSLEEAAKVLGVSPDASEQEVKSAYRSKALKTHPDHGGSNEAMVELNVAMEVLQNKGSRKPTYNREDSVHTQPSQRRWEPPKEDNITFDEAASKAGVPSGVEWLFCTSWQKDGYSGDESERASYPYVIYGQKGGKHIFVSALQRVERDNYIGGTVNSNKWHMGVVDPEIVPGPTLGNQIVSKVVHLFDTMGVRFGGKVYDIRSHKDFSMRILHSSSSSRKMAIKDWVANSGLVSSDDTSQQNRKVAVEYLYEKSMSEKSGYVKPFDTSMYEYEKHTIIINGREYGLSKADMAAIHKTRIGPKKMINAIFGDYTYDQSKKVVTRMAKGKEVLKWFAEHLDSLPSDAKEALLSASSQMKLAGKRVLWCI